MRASVAYTVEAGSLRLDYEAETDAPTVVNLSNHSYFNLSGQGNGDILKHTVMIKASQFTPVDDTLIPTGELRSVAGTPFDFAKPTPIGSRIDVSDEQIQRGHGYDHNFVLDRAGAAPTLAARATDSTSGRVLEVLTTEPGIQFYTGNFLDGTIHGRGGKVYARRYGFCFETQHFPDSPNKPEFPTTELKPGQEFNEVTVFRFSTAG